MFSLALAILPLSLSISGCGGGSKKNEIPTTAVSLGYSIDTQQGFDFVSEDSGLVVIGRIRVAVSQPGGISWFSSSEFPNQVTSVLPDGTSWMLSGKAGAPDLEFRVIRDPKGEYLKIKLKATNSNSSEIKIPGAEILSFEPESSSLGGIAFAENPEREFSILHNGYQSWSFTGPVIISEGIQGLPLENGTLLSGGDNDDWFGDQPGLSWWMTAIKKGNSSSTSSRRSFSGEIYPTDLHVDDTLVIGALSADIFKTYIGVGKASDGPMTLSLKVIEGMTGDSVTLAPGESLEFDPVYLGADQDPVAGLDRYARAAAKITPPLVWTGDRPWGWASWYYYYSQVKEEDIVNNLNFVRQELFADGFNLVQLDDGYMPRWGEWTNNQKFPSGLTSVAGEVESAGLRPGIWIAPFLVSLDSDLVDNHPDWFLHNQNGDLITYQQPPSATHAILDVTHPDAETWLRGVIGGIRDAGFRMIKIDFIFAEAFEGVRHDSKITSMQAYHRGLEIIREAAGENMFILACGAPMLPTLGHAHAFRTGPDIAYEAVGGGNPSYNFLVHEARNTASRFFTGGNWFLNDPDQLLLREPLTLEEAKMFAVANVMAGGVFLLGDDLTSLAEDRLSLATDPVILEMAKIGKPAVPLDLFDAASQKLFSSPVMDLAGESTAPSIWWLAGEDKAGYLAFFNWRGDAREIGIGTGRLGPSYPRDIVEAFSEEKVKVKDGKISASVESHQVKLFRIRY